MGAHLGQCLQPLCVVGARQSTCSKNDNRTAAGQAKWLRMHAAALRMRGVGSGASQKHVEYHASADFGCQGLPICCCGVHGLGMGLGLAMGLLVGCHMARVLCTYVTCHTDWFVCVCAAKHVDVGPMRSSTCNSKKWQPAAATDSTMEHRDVPADVSSSTDKCNW